MSKYFKKILIPVLIFVSFAIAGSAECWVETINSEDNFTMGDTVDFHIRVDTHGDTLVAYEFYLTFDGSVFQPLFIYQDSLPFLPVDYGLQPEDYLNDTHGDIWGEDEMLNGIPGFQLDYAKFFIGENTFLLGEGIAAHFSMVVVNIPNNQSQSTEIIFDNDADNSRVTSYYLINTTTREYFSAIVNDTLSVQGYSISPSVPDTLILPGNSLSIDLDEHFYSEEYNSSDAFWSLSNTQGLNSTTAEIDENTNILSINTGTEDHGYFETEISLNVLGHALIFTQMWSVEINHPIRFVENLPTIYPNEDDTLYISTDVLFIDEDDSGPEITVWDTITTYEIGEDGIYIYSPVYLSYLGNDTISIHVADDWYGLANTKLYIRESLGRIIDTILSIDVVNINDPPILDFFGVSGDSALGDTLILFHDMPDTIALKAFVTDIDNSVFTWTFEENTFVERTLLENDMLRLLAPVDALVDTQLIVHVDDGDTTVSGAFNIKIRSVPPQILLSDPLLVHADIPYFLNMDTVITDVDTPDSLLVWEFSAFTMENDSDLTVSLEYDSLTQTLKIVSEHLENSEGIIVITVRENFDFGNVVTLELTVVYFASDAPQILTPDIILTNPDTLLAALDLDTLVFDYNDPPDSISWSLEGGDSLETVYIDSVEHILYIQSGTGFLGEDTLTLIATNTIPLSDTSEIVVKIIPRNPYPQISILPDTTVFWHSDSTFLFNLDDYISDESTSPQDIEWSVTHDNDSIAVSINDVHQVFITSSEITGSVSIIFTAENMVGYSSSDTVTVNIIQDEPPEWEHLLNIEMSKFLTQIVLGYHLSDKCSDDLTVDSGNLIYEVQTDSAILILDVEIDSLTKNVTLTLLDTSALTTWIVFSAEDEHTNISYSDTVTITVINGFAPLWGNLPGISFGNDTTYLSECLENWCEDPDTPDSLLSFTLESVNEDYIHAEIIDSANCRNLSLVPLADIPGTFFIIRAEDEQHNTDSKLVFVTITDPISIETNLSYFITPGLNKRINYILTSEESLSEVTAEHYLGDSLLPTLSFNEIDEKIWIVPYRFTDSGVYMLIVNLTGNSFNTAVDSLSLSVDLPDSEGGVLMSSSAKLILQYPNAEYSENQILILNETLYTDKYFIDTEQTLYSIESNIASDIAFVATFTGETDGSDYYSFYMLSQGQGIPIPTFIDKDGKFQASVALNSHFYFGRSLKPAQSVVLPQDHMYCYPNPFNSVISIMFFIPVEDEVKISVYNILGKRVFSDDHTVKPGLITLNWDGRDKNGQNLPTGLYFYHLSAGSKQMMNKITILK